MEKINYEKQLQNEHDYKHGRKKHIKIFEPAFYADEYTKPHGYKQTTQRHIFEFFNDNTKYYLNVSQISDIIIHMEKINKIKII